MVDVRQLLVGARTAQLFPLQMHAERMCLPSDGKLQPSWQLAILSETICNSQDCISSASRQGAKLQ